MSADGKSAWLRSAEAGVGGSRHAASEARGLRSRLRRLAQRLGVRKQDYWRAVDALLGPHEMRHDLRVLGRQRWQAPPEVVLSSPFRHLTLNALAHPNFWADPAWLQTLEEIDPGNPQLHRKAFEYAQTAVGLRALGAVRPDAQVLAVGAGHDLLLYWLANRVAKVVAVDLYERGNAQWSGHEGDPSMLDDPARFARVPYVREALEVQAMDGRALRFPEATFDAVYSLSSIEHFGDQEGVRAAMREIERVLKPGGIAAIATEFVLNEVPRPETFTLPELERDLLRSTALKLVQPISFDVSLADFKNPVRLDRGEVRVPHLIVRTGRTIFTSILLFFQK